MSYFKQIYNFPFLLLINKTIATISIIYIKKFIGFIALHSQKHLVASDARALINYLQHKQRVHMHTLCSDSYYLVTK